MIPDATHSESSAYLDLPLMSAVRWARLALFITLNGEPFEIDEPLTVTDLLTRLAIDPRRVAVEHNLSIIKRHQYATAMIGEGDTIEIVNFVGGGCSTYPGGFAPPSPSLAGAPCPAPLRRARRRRA